MKTKTYRSPYSAVPTNMPVVHSDPMPFIRALSIIYRNDTSTDENVQILNECKTKIAALADNAIAMIKNERK